MTPIEKIASQSKNAPLKCELKLSKIALNKIHVVASMEFFSSYSFLINVFLVSIGIKKGISFMSFVIDNNYKRHNRIEMH